MVSVASDYRSEVFVAARERRGVPIYNASLEHASVVIEALFNTADRNVSILTGSLNPKVYGGYDIVSQALAFASKPASELYVLLEENDEDLYQYNPFVQILKKFDKVEFRHIPKAVQGRYEFHFMVADCDSYRFEQNRNSPVAVAAFGHSEGGDNLCSVFNSLWDDAGTCNSLTFQTD